MGRLILIAAPSGSGKSTSLRNLNPEETFIIKPNAKPLPFKGGRKKNIHITNNLVDLRKAILNINTKATHVKNLVVEDFYHYMLAKSMADISKPGFQKYADLGKEVFYATAGLESELREDLNLIILTHTVEERDPSGLPQTKLKLTGKFVEEKVDLPSFFTYVLEPKVLFNAGKSEYKFLTNKRSEADIAKTPFGLFDDEFIDNDLQMVLELLDKSE